jgi:hypothetical protein
LCAAAGDKASLAIGMAGLVIDHAYHDRIREASQLASEHMALIESLGDPTLTVALATSLIYAKIERAEWADVLQRSQTVIDLADGEPSKDAAAMGAANSGRPHRRKERIPPGPEALAAAAELRDRLAAWLSRNTACR